MNRPIFTTINTVEADQISTLLTQAFQPVHIEVIDEAELHGSHTHAGAGHFQVIITSPVFNGKTKVQIHRMIYTVLEPFMNNGIHALAINAKAN